MELRLTLEGGRDRCHSGGFLLRIMPPSWQPVPACTRNGHSAGGTFLPATTIKLQAGHSPCDKDKTAGGQFFPATTQNRRRAVHPCDNDKAAGGQFNTATTGFRRRNYSSLRQRKLESDAATLRQSLRRRAVEYCDNGLTQAELLFFETTKIRIRRGSVAATTAAGELFYLPERWLQ